MKKGLILLASLLSLLVLLLSACGDDTGDDGHDHDHGDTNTEQSGTTTNSSTTGNSTQNSTGGSSNKNDNENNDISSPETECKVNKNGHYWSKIALNRNTSSTGTIAISGVCEYCGDSLYKISTALVDYNEWKTALSKDSLKSFTEILPTGEYVDYDESGSIVWRVDEKGTYTSDFFINNEEKSSTTYAERFLGFALQYDDFKYDSITKAYVYWINEKSYIELGFADGVLISYTSCSVKDENEEKNTTLYLNHGRIDVEYPSYIEDKFKNSLSLDSLLGSNLSESLANGIYSELSSLVFSGKFEASLLENDRVSIYFYLDESRKCPISGEDYLTVSVVITEGFITKITFENTSVEISYK